MTSHRQPSPPAQRADGTVRARISPPESLSRIARPALLVLIFFAALLTVGEIVRRRLPFPPIPSVQPKVTWLLEHGDDYDVLFVGSSRTHRHIVPELFDQLMAEAGHPTRSFNFGFDGMRPPEDSYVLEAILANRRRPLKYVLVEGNDLRVNLAAEAYETMRTPYWHDLKRCAVVVRATLWMTSSDEPTRFGIWSDRFSNIGIFLSHVSPALSRAANFGRGYEFLPDFQATDGPASSLVKNLGEKHDGYTYRREARDIKDSNRKKLEAGLAARLKSPTKPFFSDAESQRVLQEKRRVVLAHGGRMMVFHPPMTQAEAFYPDPRFGPSIPVINLSDPRLHPELFDARYRKDESHLNAEGAEIFTRLLVAKILEIESATNRLSAPLSGPIQN